MMLLSGPLIQSDLQRTRDAPIIGQQFGDWPYRPIFTMIGIGIYPLSVIGNLPYLEKLILYSI